MSNELSDLIRLFPEEVYGYQPTAEEMKAAMEAHDANEDAVSTVTLDEALKAFGVK